MSRVWFTSLSWGSGGPKEALQVGAGGKGGRLGLFSPHAGSWTAEMQESQGWSARPFSPCPHVVIPLSVPWSPYKDTVILY